MPIHEEILALLRSQEQIDAEIIEYLPSNYAELIESSLITEYNQEKKKLLDLFYNADHDENIEENVKTAFKELCLLREKENTSSCLSFTAMPDGICNRLYFDIARVLFDTKNFNEIFKILMPSIQSCLVVQVSETLSPKNSFSYKLEDRIQVSLQLQSLNTFVAYPAEHHYFTQIVSGNNVVLDLNTLRHFPLFIHHKLFNLLNDYPVLKEKLYTHNNDFQKLLFDIELLEKNGTTPNQALSRLINDLIRSGSRYTGADEAAENAIQACVQFRVYLEQFPETFQNTLLALKSVEESHDLYYVLEQLQKGGCVETAADLLTAIKENGRNKAILNNIPNSSPDQLQKIKNHYRQPINVTGYDKTKVLPSSLLPQLLGDISISSPYDYIDLLLNLPPAEYLAFFTHVNISCYPSLPDVLGEGLEMFTPEQQQQFYLAIIDQKEKFGGMMAIIYFAAKNNLTPFFNLITKDLNPAEKNRIYSTPHKGTPLLNSAAETNSVEIFRQLWDGLSKRNKSKALIDENENTLLGLILKNVHMEIFDIVWSSLNDTMKNNAIISKNSKGLSLLNIAGGLHTNHFLQIFFDHLLKQEEISFNSVMSDLLHNSLNYPEIFQSIWDHVPLGKELFFSNTTVEGHTLFNRAIMAVPSNKRLIEIILPSLSSLEEQRETICKKNEEGQNSLYYCLSFYTLNIFKKLWPILTPDQQKQSLTEKDKNNKSLFYFSIDHLKICKLFLTCIEEEHVLSALNDLDTMDLLVNKEETFNLIWDYLSDPGRRKAINIYSQEHHLLSLSCFGKEQIWKTLWDYHSNDEKFCILKKNYYNNNTFLHYTVSHKNKLADILKFLECSYKNEKFSVISRQNNDGNTPLHLLLIKKLPAANFSEIWDGLSTPEKLNVINIKNGMNETILHLAASHISSDIFDVLWKNLPPDEKVNQAKLKSSLGGSLLHYAVKSLSTEIVETLWDFYEDKLIALQEEHLFNWAHDHFSIHSKLLEVVPKENRLNILIQMKDDVSSLHWCVQNHSPKVLKNILKHLPDDHKLNAVLAECKHGNSLLQLAIIYRNREVFTFLLDYFSENFPALMEKKNNVGNTVLHLAANSTRFIFYTILSSYSGSEKLHALCDENINKATPLHYIIQNDKTMFFNILWGNLSASEKHELSKLAVDNEYGLLAFTTPETKVEIWETLWEFYSTPNGNNPLHICVQNNDAEMFQNILINLPKSVVNSALHKKNDKNQTPLYLAKQSPDFLSKLTALIPEDDRISSLIKKDSMGNILVLIAAKSSKIWFELTSCLSDDDLLSIVYCKNMTGNSVLHKAAANTDTDVLNDILAVIPDENKLPLLTERNYFGYSPLQIAKKNNPCGFQTMLNHLFTDENELAQQENEGQLTLFKPAQEREEENVPAEVNSLLRGPQG